MTQPPGGINVRIKSEEVDKIDQSMVQVGQLAEGMIKQDTPDGMTSPLHMDPTDDDHSPRVWCSLLLSSFLLTRLSGWSATTQEASPVH